MRKLFISLSLGLILPNTVMANPVNHMSNASLYGAIHENVLANAQSNETSNIARPYTHESQKYNSLFASVLAIQGVKANIVINANSKVDYSRHKDISEQNNSLFRGALAK